MRCPQCSLVHPPGTEICRRCEIDLKTGESRPRSSFVIAPRSASPVFARVKDMARRTPAWIPGRPMVTPEQGPAAPPEPTPARTSPHGPGREDEKTRAGARMVAVFRKPKSSLAARFKLFEPKGNVANLTCLQCAGPMTITRQAPFSPIAPVALFIFGALLAVAGLKFHLLFLTAPIAVALGFVYLKIGRTYWKCNSCGFTIPRFSG